MDSFILGVSLGSLIGSIVAAVVALRVERKLEKLERAGFLITSEKTAAPKTTSMSRRELAKLIEKKAAARAGV